MNRSKAIAVTMMLSVLLLCCLACCWALQIRLPVYIVLGLLALWGFVAFSRRLCAWLVAEAPLEPPMPTVLGDDSFSLDYEAIRDEIRKEGKA